MNHSNDEEYIEIEVNSYYYFSSSPPNSSSSQITKNNKEFTTSQLFEDLEDSFCINLLITPISSPSQTCIVSFELNPNDHKMISFKKLWSKLMIKHSLINQKLKASREFLKSLFSNFSCTNSNCCSSKDIKKKTSNGTSRWHYSTKYFSSSSTNSSTNCGSFSSFNSSFNSNNGFTCEDSIEAHCKKSQQCGWAYKDIND